MIDLASIKGHETAKRAIEIAASGQHNILFAGPPGHGKSLLIEALSDLIPDVPIMIFDPATDDASLRNALISGSMIAAASTTAEGIGRFFDITAEVPALSVAELVWRAPSEPSARVADRIGETRLRSAGRINGHLSGPDLDEAASMNVQARELLMRAGERMGLTARSWDQVVRVARTVADMDGCASIERTHVAEALAYSHHGLAG